MPSEKGSVKGRRLRRTFSAISTKDGKKVWKSAVCEAKSRVEDSELFENLQKSCYNSTSTDEMTEFVVDLVTESQRLTMSSTAQRSRWKFWSRK